MSQDGKYHIDARQYNERDPYAFQDDSPFWLASKRLERATFQWPKDEVAVTQMSLAQLRLLLEGFELKSRRGWRRYEKRMSKPAAEEIVTRDL